MNPHQLPDGIRYGVTCEALAQTIAERHGLRVGVHCPGGYDFGFAPRTWGVKAKTGGAFRLLDTRQGGLFSGHMKGTEYKDGIALD